MTVVDASVIVRLLLARKSDDLLRRRIIGAGRTLFAPAHIDIEVLSAICGLCKGNKITEDRAHRMSEQLQALRITRYGVASLGERIVRLRHNFTAYDAAYIALAERLGQPLLTTDAKFARAPDNTHEAEIHMYPD